MSWAYKTNWCWPQKAIKILWREIKPPHRIFFKASCDKHDELYWKGGKEIDREMADRLFLYYMVEDVKRLPIYKRPYYYIWAKIYYFAVRLGGKSSFNYK